jgi:hypothetical protein
MPDVELLATGEGDYRLHDPDALRAWMRDRKRRDFVDKTTTAAEAVRCLVADGDYVSFDFSSFARGYLDGTPEARKRAGLPAGTGPWRVVTSKALFGFDEVTHELTLLGILDGLSVEEVTAELSVKPRVAAHVERLAPPSARELEILRDEIDPARTIIGRTAKS